MEDFVNCSSISIESSGCIRSNFQKSHCRDCENICIVKAIVFSPEASVRKSDCIKCGLCYAACKFSAINIKKDNKQLIEAVDETKTVDIGCIFSNSDIKIACISRITEDVLINWFIQNKTVLIKKGDCKKCIFKETLPYFTKSLKKSVILAKAFDIKPKLKITTDKSSKVYIPKDNVSRRNMFLGLGIIAPRSTPKRELLKEVVVKNAIKSDIIYTEAAELDIGNTCTLCGICEHICPTKAIEIEKRDDKGILYFNPSLCVSCRECETACIYGALEVLESTTSQLITKSHKVFETKKQICKVCKKEFYSNDKSDTCSICQTKEKGRSKFLEFLKDI